ncbi:hypothetical protein BH11MYX4_BH11MYX4_50020 [soil metagenome]
MSAPTITALYAALNAVLNIYLANRVSSVRGKTKVGLGTGGSPEVEVAVRMHGNNAEFVPLALLLMLLAELCGGASAPLHVYGGVLLLARVAHPLGLTRPAPNVFRWVGTAATYVGIVAASAWLLWLRTKH